MPSRPLRAVLQAFADEASVRLGADSAQGADVPFEVVEHGGRDAPLYCYRPLVGAFIAQRAGVLTRLASYVPAADQLAGYGGLTAYLEARGERAAGTPRERADAALLAFLARVFGEDADFVLRPERLRRELDELEALGGDACAEVTVVAPVLGLALESAEVPLGDGLTLLRGDVAAEDVPAEAVWAPGAAEPHVLAVLQWDAAAAPVAHARARLRALLLALRLYDGAPLAFGPLAWTRTGAGVWQPFALGATGAGPDAPVVVPAQQEDELRAFCSLVTRRAPRSGEVAWALARFMTLTESAGREQALSDVLLALRALLEPEGLASGLMARRLAVLCAAADDRPALAERGARAMAAERAVVAGRFDDARLAGLVEDLAGHLRALLRDVLCGHLDADLRATADRLLAEEAAGEQRATA